MIIQSGITGINVNGNLNLINCTITDNTAKTGDSGFYTYSGIGGDGDNGGGIYNVGTLNIIGCIIENNRAGEGGLGRNGTNGGTGASGYYGSTVYPYDGTGGRGDNGYDGRSGNMGGHGGNGGAIYNAGTLTITESIIQNNQAGWGGQGGRGGNGGNGGNGGSGAYFGGSGGWGGWGANGGNGGEGGDGGAIYNAGTLTITESIIQNNRAGSGGYGGHGGSGGYGGSGGHGALGNGANGYSGPFGSDGYRGSGGNGGAIQNLITMNMSLSVIYNNKPGTDDYGSYTGIGTIYNIHNDIYGEFRGTGNLNNNYWGSNQDPKTSAIICGDLSKLNADKWIVFKLDTLPNNIGRELESSIIADFTHNSNGEDISSYGHIPNEIPVSFNTTLGTINSLSTTNNGIAVSILNGGIVSGIAHISAAFYGQNLTKDVTIDAINPNINAIDPLNNAVNVPSTKMITITFNEPIKLGNMNIELRDMNNNLIAINPPTISLNKLSLTIKPINSLDESKYTILLNEGSITDLSRNPIATYTSSFSVGTSPIITNINPVNNSVNNPVNNIKITFSEPIQIGNNYNNIKVISNLGIEKSITKNIENNVLTLTADFDSDGIYTITIPTMAITDIAGNRLENNYSSIFSVDITPPTVNSNLESGLYNTTKTVKLQAFDNIDTNPVIYYSFNNGITWGNQAKSITLLINPGETNLMFYAMDAIGHKSLTQTKSYIIDIILPTVSADIKGGIYNTTKVVTLSTDEPGTIYFTLNGDIPTTNSIEYTGPITIYSTTTLKFIAIDTANNKSPVYTETYTIDKTAPTVKYGDPLNSATNVARNKVITITFSEAIKKGTDFIELKASKGTIIPITTSVSGNVLTISHSALLANGVKYNLILHTGCVVDLAGNKLALTTSSFTTDGTAPTVTSIDPANGATNIARNKLIKVYFSEPIKKGTTCWVELKASNGTTVPIKTSISASGSVLYINHSTLLAPNTKYTVILHSGCVTDLAGNSVALRTFSFTTGST